jgi:hypothetical protein
MAGFSVNDSGNTIFIPGFFYAVEHTRITLLRVLIRF